MKEVPTIAYLIVGGIVGLSFAIVVSNLLMLLEN